MSDEVEYLVDKLLSTLTTGAKYASRRGAAYGLAGVVKGRGLTSLKEYDLIDKLKDAAEDKSAFQSRQGAVFAFEWVDSGLPGNRGLMQLQNTIFHTGESIWCVRCMIETLS